MIETDWASAYSSCWRSGGYQHMPSAATDHTKQILHGHWELQIGISLRDSVCVCVCVFLRRFALYYQARGWKDWDEGERSNDIKRIRRGKGSRKQKGQMMMGMPSDCVCMYVCVCWEDEAISKSHLESQWNLFSRSGKEHYSVFKHFFLLIKITAVTVSLPSRTGPNWLDWTHKIHPHQSLH